MIAFWEPLLAGLHNETNKCRHTLYLVNWLMQCVYMLFFVLLGFFLQFKTDYVFVPQCYVSISVHILYSASRMAGS